MPNVDGAGTKRSNGIMPKVDGAGTKPSTFAIVSLFAWSTDATTALLLVLKLRIPAESQVARVQGPGTRFGFLSRGVHRVHVLDSRKRWSWIQEQNVNSTITNASGAKIGTALYMSPEQTEGVLSLIGTWNLDGLSRSN